MKVLSPTSGFPTWGSGNRRRNSQRIRLWRLTGFDCRTSTGLGETETPLLEDTHKVVCASGPSRKEQWPHRRLNTYLLVLEGLLQRQGWLWLTVGTRTLAAEVLGTTPWREPSWSLPLAPPKSPVASSAGSPQAKWPTRRELSPTHQQTSRLKFYWALPTWAIPSSIHHQSLPSGSLHKPLRYLHPSEGRQEKQEELQSGSLWNENHITSKTNKMKRQRTMYQMRNKIKPQKNN